MEIFARVEKVIAVVLLVLMGFVVIAGALEVAYVVFTELLEPPGFFLGVEDLFDIFGLFLMVLIGLELMTSIEMYLRDSMIHAEVMFLVALTAVARKVVILDAKLIDPLTVFAIAALVIALSAGYYLIKSRNGSAPE
jgi:uncharacterized membrane protein (DUF373 family)